MSVTKKSGRDSREAHSGPKTAATPPSESPVDIVVRRGALRRFDQLKQKAAGLPVRLSWDRRVEARRSATATVPAERRRADRRQSPPFTWDVADFVIVGDQARNTTGGGRSTTAPKRRRG